MQSLAALCLLLTLGTIIVPRGDRGVDGLVAGIVQLTQQPSSKSKDVSGYIPRRFGKRKCSLVPLGSTPPRVLRPHRPHTHSLQGSGCRVRVEL